jgi:hypothetical protein
MEKFDHAPISEEHREMQGKLVDFSSCCVIGGSSKRGDDARFSLNDSETRQ